MSCHIPIFGAMAHGHDSACCPLMLSFNFGVDARRPRGKSILAVQSLRGALWFFLEMVVGSYLPQIHVKPPILFSHFANLSSTSVGL